MSPDVTAALDHAACGLLQTDSRGVIRWANQMFCNWIGYDVADIAGRRTIQEFLTVGGRIFHQTHWVPLLEIQQSVSEVKFDVVHADGHRIPMVFNAVRRLDNHVIVHDLAVFVARDRDKYERELVSSSKQLKELLGRSAELEILARDRAAFAEQMMGIVSHDLRNPLSTIELSAMAALQSGNETEQLSALARIVRATARATRLIHDLLDFTQAQVGKGLTITRVGTDLHPTIAENLDELQTAFPDARLVHVAEGAGRCEVDPDRITQLVGNLVANAVTYGERGHAVTITSGITHDVCSVAVHNRGNPIPEELVRQLFHPMSRGASNPSPAMRSVGLGLYIVREIAKAHGGDVSVVSNASEGTTFTARFPCVAPATAHGGHA